MYTTLVIIFIVIHMAFILGLGYFVLASAGKQEIGWLKNIGMFIGGLLLIAAVLFSIIGTIWAFSADDYFENKMEKMQHSKMMMHSECCDCCKKGGACPNCDCDKCKVKKDDDNDDDDTEEQKEDSMFKKPMDEEKETENLSGAACPLGGCR